jgi:hypothetical protein
MAPIGPGGTGTSSTGTVTPSTGTALPGSGPGGTGSTALYTGPTAPQPTVEQLRNVAVPQPVWNPEIITYAPQPPPPAPPPPTGEIGTLDGILGQMAATPATPTPTNTSQYDPYLVARLDQAVQMGAMSAETASGILEGSVRTPTSGSNLTPFPFQPFGTASNTSAAETVGARGGGAFGAAGLNASEGVNVTGSFPSETGFNASPNVGFGQTSFGPDVGFGPDIGQSTSLGPTFGEPSTATSQAMTGLGQALSTAVDNGTLSPAQAEAIAAGAAASAAGGGATGGGDSGGFGGGMDGSSNAGIGGPAGTGAAGGIGAAAGAGAGTGGVGEGEQFGNQFVVGGRGGIDSMPVNFRATPGELVTVTPPGRGFGPRDARGNNRQSGIGELEAILKYMTSGRGG